jgi:ankyrin repeat protein
LTERKHADHPTGGFTALMFAARSGHEDVARALVQGGADPQLTNGDGATATAIAIVNDRFDLAKSLVDLGADPNDGSLYFAVDMRDATTDMRARDGSRLRADHQNALSALDLVTVLLERGADPNKPFIGRLHSTSLCCDAEINASPFFRAAVAADVEIVKLMIAHGAQIEWSPTEVKKDEDEEDEAPGGRGNPNVGRTPMMVALSGGRGAAFAAGPGFDRLAAPPYREPAIREPLDAIKVLLAAGADPNAKAPDGATLLHQAVAARQVPIIGELVAAGARFDAVNKDNLTPLQLAEVPEPPPPRGNNTDARAYRRPRDTREDVIAALRGFMGLGPDDPTPQPPPAPAAADDEDDEKGGTANEKPADDSGTDDETTGEANSEEAARSADAQAETAQ